MGCCTRPGTAGYRYGLGLSNPGHTHTPSRGLAGRWRVGTFKLRAKRLSTVNPNDARRIICRYVFLFVSYFLTNHAGSRRPTMANKGQRRSTKAHSSQQRPTTANKGQRRSTKANAGQRRPTQAHEGPQQPTTANEGQRSVFFFIFYSLFLLLRDSAHPTPRLQIRAGGGFTHHHQPPTITTTTTSTQVNESPQQPMMANKG